MGAKNRQIQIGALREDELEQAGHIVRLAFGTFLGLPNPLEFMGDRDFLSPRWRSRNARVLAAREDGKLIGTNVATRWGSFAFFGPLTVLPDYWNRRVAQQLMAATVKVIDRWGVRRSGLFTFPHSAKHVGLYQKFDYWPGSLTALMRHAPLSQLAATSKKASEPVFLSALSKSDCDQAIKACAKLAGGIQKGLDLSEEIRSVLAQRIGEVPLIFGRRALHRFRSCSIQKPMNPSGSFFKKEPPCSEIQNRYIDCETGLDSFAVCMHGAGSEGGAKTLYIKFAAARAGSGSREKFDRLLDAVEALALKQHAEVEAGISLACRDAYKRMIARGYRATTLGVAMQRPHGDGFNRAGSYVINDWR
jgi:GNAT superfamily N-acetyltransferase